MKEAARRLGVSVWTVYRRCARGELAHVRLGATILVNAGAVGGPRSR